MFLHHVLGIEFSKAGRVLLDDTEKQAKRAEVMEEFRNDGSLCGCNSVLASHAVRSGQPAATQARSSSGRQNAACPKRMARGILPMVSHIRQVRVEMLHSAAAWGARSRRSIDSAPQHDRQPLVGQILSVVTDISPIRQKVGRFDSGKVGTRTDRVVCLFLYLPGRRSN